MAAVRLAAVFLAAISAPLGAQQDVFSHFSIGISDLNGAPVSTAEIEAIERPAQIIGTTKTDVNGNAALDLPPGHRVYLLIPNDSREDEKLPYEAFLKHFNVPIKRFDCSDSPGPGWHQVCTLQFDGSIEQDQSLRIIAVVGELPCTLCVGFNPALAIPLQHVEAAQTIPTVPVRILELLPSKRIRTH